MPINYKRFPSGFWPHRHRQTGYLKSVDSDPPPNPSTEDSRATSRIQMMANFDFAATKTNELSFKRCDILSVQVNPSSRWWKATNWRTGGSGQVPDSYLTDHPDEPNLAFEAWQVVSREEAERQLMMHGLASGTYILRPGSEKNTYTIAVLHQKGNEYEVKHYQILQSVQKNSVQILPNQKFSSLTDLLQFYSHDTNHGLICALSNPRPKIYCSINQFYECRISRNSLKMIRLLGKGNFGEVHLAEHRNVLVAVKKGFSSITNKDIVEEAYTMHKFNHPRLVRLLGVCCEPAFEPIWIITEFMPKGSLHDFLKTEEGHALHLNQLVYILEQIVQGMIYLETRGAVHNDLRSANVLVDTDNSVKVSDFGLTKFLQQDERDTSVGTFPTRWTAPEATKDDYILNIKADVWSFGVLMFEVFTYSLLPYSDIVDDQDLITAVESGYRLSNPKVLGYECDDVLYNIMISCWASEPKERPSFSQLERNFPH